MQTENAMIAAWQNAADDLGIEVASPFIVDGEPFPVHVPLFGRPAGALPVLMGDQRSGRAAEARGFFLSLLNPDLYCKYDRSQFIETLVDWGWFGSLDDTPGWYLKEVSKLRAR
jgi:hypothetical protein